MLGPSRSYELEYQSRSGYTSIHGAFIQKRPIGALLKPVARNFGLIREAEGALIDNKASTRASICPKKGRRKKTNVQLFQNGLKVYIKSTILYHIMHVRSYRALSLVDS